MEKKHILIGFAIAAVVILIIASVVVYSTIVSSKGDPLTLVGFDPDAAYADMQALCAIGPRGPGTEEDLEGAQYVEGKFTEAGLSDVHIEEYPVTTYRINSAEMSLITLSIRGQVVTDYTHLEDFVLYEYSGSTNGILRLEIVNGGDGSEEALSAIDCDGKAVITTMQCLPRAVEHGARAVIVQNLRLGEQYDYPPYQGGLYGGDSNGDSIPYPDAYPDAVVPTCSVSKAVGDEILGAIDSVGTIPIIGISRVWIQLNFDTTIGTNPIYNVVGDVKGSKHPDQVVYVVAHRDSTYISPGAVDDLCGTVTVMEMARQLAKYRPERTIRFISMDAEEIGVIGATEYAKAHEGEISGSGVFCINFDMNDVDLEHVDTLDVSVSNGSYKNKMVEIIDLMYERNPDIKSAYNINLTFGGGGPDDGPFRKRGLEAAFAMGEWGSSWEYHTALDTIEYVNKDSWRLSGFIFGTLALDLAGRA